MGGGVAAFNRAAPMFELRLNLPRSEQGEILCEVIDLEAGVHRCEEEYKVLLENAMAKLAASPLWPPLSRRRLRWRIVRDDQSGTQELWRPEPGAADAS
jgi:hypothetical protein